MNNPIILDNVGCLYTANKDGVQSYENTKIFIDKSKNHKPKAAEIKLTGSAIAGTITALRFPKNR